MQKTQAIIVAGGTGQRMGNAIPKQFLLLHNKPIIYWTLKAFEKFSIDTEIIIVIHANYKKNLNEILSTHTIKNKIIVVDGGLTRFDSVKNGVRELFTDSIVFVHDAVRCLVNSDVIQRCYESAVRYGSGVPAIALNESARWLEGDKNKCLERAKIRIMQTPQTFQSAILIEAFQRAYQSHFTDEANVVEALGKTIHLVVGDDNNLKITFAKDLAIANYLLEKSLQ